ncbi:helix-turn-helix domain-containing protein [Salinactinospora qingdaonensis]|uniref:Helix-turn-helix transcriptional regulator n=1 Tax=Salinactinospora qingdaonensis TaxID=702744 RepID=A0ABP7G998_9ACTN
MTDYQTARVSLGVRLRELRADTGLSGRTLAQRLGWHPSKISKLENGKQTATVDDLRAWSEACGQPGAVDGLLAQRRSLETHYASWRRQLAGGTGARQAAFGDLERGARRIRVFEAACVPGLLQTAEYARYIIRHGIRLHSTPDDLDNAVRARMRRQSILNEPHPICHILIWEPVLRMRLCPADVMVEQVDRIAESIKRSRLDIGILPTDAELDVVPSHGFWIFDEDRVLVETVSAELCLTDRDAIAPYRQVFTKLSRVALRGVAAQRLVVRARHALTNDPEDG